MNDHLSWLPIDCQIEQYVLVNGVVIELIVRAKLVIPHGLSCIRVACENSIRPFIIAGPLIGIPNAGVASAVKDQIRVSVVRNESPNGRTA